jgi:metallophosphoesterase superfamily enzyme
MHPRFLRFLKKIEDEYSCSRVVHLGDMVDWHAISYHERDPSMPSAQDEYRKAKKQVKKLHAAFPKLDYMMGNHCALPQRKARTAGLLDDMMVSFEDFWGLDGWTVHPRYAKIEIDGVQYRHGDSGKAGQFPAFANSQTEFKSVVQGHFHTAAGVRYHSNENNLVFGMQVGCGATPNHPAMNYAKVYSNRPILGCGVILEGKVAIFEPMPMK